MKVPFYKRLTAADFVAHPWVEKLLTPMGIFLDALRVGLNNGLTFADNMQVEIREFELNEVAFPFAFVPERKPSHMILTYCKEVSDQHVALSLGGIDWDNTADGQVTIYGITGLNAGRDYVLRVMLWE